MKLKLKNMPGTDKAKCPWEVIGVTDDEHKKKILWCSDCGAVAHENELEYENPLHHDTLRLCYDQGLTP